MLGVVCWLFVNCWSFFVARRWSFVVCSWFALFVLVAVCVVCGLLFVVSCLLMFVCGLMCVRCGCVLLVGRSSFFVLRYSFSIVLLLVFGVLRFGV